MPFNLLEMFRIVTPSMMFRGAAYPFHAAYEIVKGKRPKLSGLAFWREVRLTARQLASTPTPPIIPSASEFSYLGDFIRFDHTKRGHIKILTTNGTIDITSLSPQMVHIRIIWDETTQEPRQSYALEKPISEWSALDIEINDAADHLNLSLDSLAIRVSKHPCRIKVMDSAGNTIFAETAGFGRHTESGCLNWRAAFHPDSAFYGLGEKAAALNHAGKRFEMWNYDQAGYGRGSDPIYMNIPFFTALTYGTAAGVFFDNTHRAWIDLGAEQNGHVEWVALGGEQSIYVMVGTPQEVIEQYIELTGRTKLPPLWALGFHQSRWSYFQEEVMSLMREFRQRQIPCDAIHLDIHYMDGYRCFTWSKERFPDKDAMLHQLKQAGYHVISIIDPGIKIDRRYWVYIQGVDGDMFLKYPHGARFVGPVWPGDCHFPDFTNPRVREWWGALYRGLLDDGVDAFWNDMNEPALITRVIGNSIPDMVKHNWEGQGSSHAAAHNVYGMQMARASSEGIAKLRSDKRPLIITRSGFAGIQRHAIHWTGDNGSTWDHLRLSVQMVLTLGLSGIPITGPDIGGFSGGPSPELFARWIEVGALFPFCRVHSMIGSPQQEPWQFGAEVENITREYLGLRYRLLPYLYTAAWQASQKGTPIMRALPFMYPNDTKTYSMDDQFMLGDSLLVAPVMDEGAVSRDVYLPDGRWFDFWTHEAREGGRTITVEAPLDRLPLFVRAGAVIPFWPLQQHIGQKEIEVLDMQVYWTDGGYTSPLYEDDGESPEYILLEKHRVTRFIVDGDTRTIQRIIEQGEYQPLYRRIRVHIIGLPDVITDIEIEGGILINRTQIEPLSEEIIEIESHTDFTIKLN